MKWTLTSRSGSEAPDYQRTLTTQTTINHRRTRATAKMTNRILISFHFLLLGLFATDVPVASSVKIRELKVPSTYILDVNDPFPAPIQMDCLYDVTPGESGFVLKWLLDGIPVYQWIPPKKPQAIAFFRPRTDATFEVDGNAHEKFRSLKITRPEFNMTGEFTCSVQTFQSSDSRSAKLQIIVPDRDFQLSYRALDQDNVIIKCTTTGVYPKPKLTIMIDNDNPLNVETDGSGQSNDGLYEAIVRVKVPKSSLRSPAAINCVLTIPGTNYTKKRETIFYDTVLTTSTPEEDDSSLISRLAVYGKSGSSASTTTSSLLRHPCLLSSLIGILLLQLARV